MTNEVDRLFDEMGPSWPEAVVTLIDALRDYVRAEDEMGEDLLREGSITREQFDEARKDRWLFTSMLKQLEKHGVDPTLQGLIEWRFRA